MPLTSAQYTTLKAAILADPVLNAFPNTPDGNFDLARKLSTELASPAFIGYQKQILIKNVGDAMLSADIANLSTANTNRLIVEANYSGGLFTASADLEAGFNDIFTLASAAVTKANLRALWRRSLTRIEKIFATGVGSDAVPATVVYEGAVSALDVEIARNTA